MSTRDSAWASGTPCWVDVQVDDTTAARNFYSTLFGWEIQDAGPDSGGYLMATLNGRAVAGIGPKQSASAPSAWVTYISADDVDAVAGQIAAAGGSVPMAPMDVGEAGRMAIAADPGGAIFGLWQAGKSIGVEIVNVDGALTWNDLHTTEYKAAQDFYKKIYDYTYTEVGDGKEVVYSIFGIPQAPKERVGGVAQAPKLDTPPYWLAWFQVGDVDATIKTATELGAKVVLPAKTSPTGRAGVLRAPQGEVFSVVDRATTS
ncbi:VOC family protein [Nocardia lasii]|uniref:VOC family protein n=1 Tax=Nocardia lasii TaxID=1616107 RepID=A0ABW1JKB9_9NOCA